MVLSCNFFLIVGSGGDICRSGGQGQGASGAGFGAKSGHGLHVTEDKPGSCHLHGKKRCNITPKMAVEKPPLYYWGHLNKLL